MSIVSRLKRAANGIENSRRGAQNSLMTTQTSNCAEIRCCMLKLIGSFERKKLLRERPKSHDNSLYPELRLHPKSQARTSQCGSEISGPRARRRYSAQHERREAIARSFTCSFRANPLKIYVG